MRWPWLLVALLLTGIAGGAVIGLRHYFVPVAEYQRQTRQMNGIAAKIDELGEAVITPSAGPFTAGAASENLEARLQRMEEKLAAAPAAPLDPALLEQRLAAIETRLQALDTTTQKLNTATFAATTLFRIAVHQQAALIAGLVANGAPFLAELDLLRTLGQEAMLALPAPQLDTLAGVARFGVPASRMLAEELDSLANTIDLVIPAEKPAKSDSEITGALASFINLRRIDGAAGERRKEAFELIDTARKHLQDDNIPAALETLSGLPEDVQADIAYESWTERAQLALKARDAAEILQDVTAEIASGQTTAPAAATGDDAATPPTASETPASGAEATGNTPDTTIEGQP
jgi:hypothetical protein